VLDATHVLDQIESLILKDNELNIINEGNQIIQQVFRTSQISSKLTKDEFWREIIDRGYILYTATPTDRIQLLTDIKWSNLIHRIQYLIYYSSQYIPRIQLDIIKVLRKRGNTNTINLVDIGVGVGTTFIALISLIKKYNYLVKYRNKHNLLLIKHVNYYYLDKNPEALNATQETIQICTNFVFDSTIDINTYPGQFTLGQETLGDNTNKESLIITICNVLAELNTTQLDHVAKSLSTLTTDSSVILAEFGGNHKLVTTLGERTNKRHLIFQDKNSMYYNGSSLWYNYQRKLAQKRGLRTLPRGSGNIWTRMLIL